jgi:hypothetical protein
MHIRLTWLMTLGGGGKSAMGTRSQVKETRLKEGEECFETALNALNAGLNPICHLLALLGAHHILYVSR